MYTAGWAITNTCSPARAEQRTAAAGPDPGSGSDDGDLNKLSTEKLVR